MKNIKSLIILAAMAFFVSCSNSSDDTVTPPVDRSLELIGNWDAIGYTIEGNTTTIINSDESFVTIFEGIGFEMNHFLSFSDGPRTFSNQGDYRLEVVSLDPDGVPSTQLFFIPVAEDGSWEFNNTNNTLTFMENGEERIVTILELSPTTLKFRTNIDTTVINGNTQVTTSAFEIYTYAWAGN